LAVLLTAIVAGRPHRQFVHRADRRDEIARGNRCDPHAGLDPVDLLVLPRVLALLVMPLLTFVAMLAGLAGGVTVGAFDLGIPPQMYLARMHETMEVRHFWSACPRRRCSPW
jgi:phospholipid/cholesterol/gamma-HCH transport system permease protein